MQLQYVVCGPTGFPLCLDVVGEIGSHTDDSFLSAQWCTASIAPCEHVMHDGTPTSFVIRASANLSLIAQARYIHSFRSFPRVFIVSVGHIPRVAYHHDAANQRNSSGRGMYWIGRQYDVMIPSPILRWWFWFAGCWVCCPTSVRLGSSVIRNNPQQKT